MDFEGWLGRTLSGAERRAASRSLARLADAGLIVRVGGWEGARTASIRVIEGGAS